MFESEEGLPPVAGMPPAPVEVGTAPVIPALPNPLVLPPRELDIEALFVELVGSEKLPDAPARGVLGGVEVFACPVKPRLESAFPPAYGVLVLCLLQQLQPVNSMPIPHAPIRLAKGILPIGFSSPRVIPFTPRAAPASRGNPPAHRRPQCSLWPMKVGEP